MRRQETGLGVPDELFHRHPAHALDETALDLADVHGRVERLADIVQQVGAQKLPLAGEGVDDDLAHRRAIGVVVERVAGHGLGVPRQARRGVEAVGPQLHAVEVRVGHDGAEIKLLARHEHLVVGKAHVLGLAAVALRDVGRQAITDLARRILRRLAVQVRAGGCGRGRGVGHLAGVGGREAHAFEVHAQLVRHHLHHLGVQALAHLGAAVVHEDGTIEVHVHEGARLVQVLDVEADAELHRRERQALLEHGARGVERRHLLAPRGVVAAGFKLVHELVDDVVFHCLAIGRDVVIVLAVEVGAAHRERVLAEFARDAVQDVFHADRALRPAEAAKRRVALRVGLAAIAVHGHLGQPVGVVEVADGARHHGGGEVRRVPRVRDHLQRHAQHVSVVVVAHVVLVPEAVAPAGDHEVVVAVQAQLDRTVQGARRHRGDAGELRRLRFLAAEASAHAAALHQHGVRLDAERVCDEELHLARVLRRAVDMHAAAFLGQRVADLTFEVELLLSAHVQTAREPVRRLFDRGVHACFVQAAHAARQLHGGHHVLLFFVGLARRDHGLGAFGLEHALGERGGAARLLARLRHHGKHRLAQIADLAVAEDRVVVQHRAAVVLAGNVRGREHAHHAGHGAHGGQVAVQQPARGHGGEAERAVQRAGQLGDVVGVGRGAGHVQLGRFMRAAHAHPRSGVHRRGFGAGIEARLEVVLVVGEGLVLAQEFFGNSGVHDDLLQAVTAVCGSTLKTLVAWLASGATARVSSHRRCSRFCATCRRYALLARMSVMGA